MSHHAWGRGNESQSRCAPSWRNGHLLAKTNVPPPSTPHSGTANKKKRQPPFFIRPRCRTFLGILARCDGVDGEIPEERRRRLERRRLLRWMISARPGLAIALTNWLSVVGIHRREGAGENVLGGTNHRVDKGSARLARIAQPEPVGRCECGTPAWLPTPITNCARQSCPGCARQHSVRTLSSANSSFPLLCPGNHS